jgi:dTDP-4-amino-4,6-dideoxygalactose transaminase
VPLLDLKRQYAQIGRELEKNVLSVLRSGNYILGDWGQRLEHAVADICGTKHGIAVANGTDALILALWALNIGPDDEVITPPFTFAATAEAIAMRGAKIVFVDVDPITFNLDPAKLEAAITPRTAAIIPVHLYGQPADMAPIMQIARKYNLRVIEDNAQAIGATYHGRPTGSFGDVACVSFYPTKNLGAAGDAGMVVTSNDAVAERLRRLRAHGSHLRYYHDELGVNSRLDEIQAAILITKIEHLETWNGKRNEAAALYQRLLKHCPSVVAPSVMPRSTHVWHQFTIRLIGNPQNQGSERLRDLVARELSARGIGNMIYYPVPLHLQQAFISAEYRAGDFPITESLSGEVLSLPMYPEITDNEIQTVVHALTEVLTSSVASLVPVSAVTSND